MNAKQVGALLLALLTVAVMPGCGTKTSGPSNPSSAESEAPAYPWMAGESPIPDRRIGISRQGLGGLGFTVTEAGYYIMGWDPRLPGTGCLFYGDHGSDTIVKLCGRPDCDHLNEDCNAWFNSGGNVYYDGSHLFVVNSPRFGLFRVTRMDLDGSNQEVILDMDSFSSLGLSSQCSMLQIVNGVFSMLSKRLDENGNRSDIQVYYKLDGSMEEPGIMAGDGDMCMMHGDGKGNFIDSGHLDMVRAWDPETNEVHELTEKKGSGYYGMEDAWYVIDGVIYHLNYASGEEEVLLDTGLRLEENEKMVLRCFPDHLMLQIDRHTDDSKSAYTSFYFYNWAMELVGQIDRIDTPHIYVCGETADRLIISAHPVSIVPQFYIEKSEFGTGHIELHEFNMPDIDWEAAEEVTNSMLGG